MYLLFNFNVQDTQINHWPIHSEQIPGFWKLREVLLLHWQISFQLLKTEVSMTHNWITVWVLPTKGHPQAVECFHLSFSGTYFLIFWLGHLSTYAHFCSALHEIRIEPLKGDHSSHWQVMSKVVVVRNDDEKAHGCVYHPYPHSTHTHTPILRALQLMSGNVHNGQRLGSWCRRCIPDSLQVCLPVDVSLCFPSLSSSWSGQLMLILWIDRKLTIWKGISKGRKGQRSKAKHFHVNLY